MANSTSFRFQLRGDTASAWSTVDPILADREPGIETDTLKLKFGDGSTPWSGLGYAVGGGSSGGGANLSVTRTTTAVTVLSDTGTDATIPAADTNAGVMTAAMKTKLDGISTAATANSSDATLLARANHTGSQASTTISDFTEAVQDAVGAFLTAGTNVTLTYDDAGNTLTVASSGSGGSGGLTAEEVRDTIGTALLGTGVITVTVNDGSDTITISSTATTNSTDAALRDRSTHTGTQSADTVVDGTTNHVFTAADDTKLAGIATSATANSSDATLLARANHTGSQTASTISDFTEAVQDAVGAFVVDGTGIDAVYDDGSNTLTISVAPTWATLTAGETRVVRKDPTTGFWPASWSGFTPVYTGGSSSTTVRPTSRSDVFLFYIGVAPAPAIVSSGTAGMLEDVDVFMEVST